MDNAIRKLMLEEALERIKDKPYDVEDLLRLIGHYCEPNEVFPYLRTNDLSLHDSHFSPPAFVL